MQTGDLLSPQKGLQCENLKARALCGDSPCLNDSNIWVTTETRRTLDRGVMNCGVTGSIEGTGDVAAKLRFLSVDIPDIENTAINIMQLFSYIFS